MKPIDADVLCGRGRAIRSHPGNQLYLKLITHYKNDYMTSLKGTKLDIVKRVVQAVRDQHGRFLQKQGLGWIDIGDKKAITKTSQAFRDLRTIDESLLLDMNPNEDHGDNEEEVEKESDRKKVVDPEDNPQCPLTDESTTKASSIEAKSTKLIIARNAATNTSTASVPSLSLKKAKSTSSTASSVRRKAMSSPTQSSAVSDISHRITDSTTITRQLKPLPKPVSVESKLAKAAAINQKRKFELSSDEDVSDTETEDSFPMYRREGDEGNVVEKKEDEEASSSSPENEEVEESGDSNVDSDAEI